MCPSLGDLRESPGSRFARVGHCPKADSAAPGHRKKSGLQGGRRRGWRGSPSAEGSGRWVAGEPLPLSVLRQNCEGASPCLPCALGPGRRGPRSRTAARGPQGQVSLQRPRSFSPTGCAGRVDAGPTRGSLPSPSAHQLCGLGRAVRLGESPPCRVGRVSRDPVQRLAQSSQQVNFFKKV